MEIKHVEFNQDSVIIDGVSYKREKQVPVCNVDKDGTKIWWLNGKLHREDGPACEYVNGSKEWYQNGMLHREDGPAVEYANGYKVWYLNGKLHREDGPAVIYINGTVAYWVNGIQKFPKFD